MEICIRYKTVISHVSPGCICCPSSLFMRCGASVPYLSNATVPRGFLSLPMLSRCTHLGIARAAPPCTSGSANDRRRTRVIAMLRQGIGTSRKISMHALKFSPDVSTPNIIGDISPNSAEQSANIRRCTPRPKMSHSHRRHVGDKSAMLV